MSEIIHVPFHDRYIHTVLVGDEPQVVLKPSVEAMGLSYASQFRKLQGRSWATVSQTTTVGADGKLRELATVDLDTWSMLLANINENKVPADRRPLIVAYQKESARALRDYWTRGRADNHRLANPSEPVTFTWDEVTAVMRQQYGVDISVPQLTRMLRSAGVLRVGMTEPRKAFRPMFWFVGTHWEVHPHAVPFLLRKVEETAAELREFRFLQARLELDGVGSGQIELR